MEDIDKFVMHQASKYVIDFLGTRMDVVPRMPFVAATIGNLVSSSLPFAFQQVVEDTDNTVVIAGFGVGFSWGINVLERLR